MLPDHPFPTSVGMDPSPPLLEIISSEMPSSLVPTDASDEASASLHSTPDYNQPRKQELYTGPTPVAATHHPPEVPTTTGSHTQKPHTGHEQQNSYTAQKPDFYTGPRTGNDLVGGSSTTSGPTPTGNTTNSK